MAAGLAAELTKAQLDSVIGRRLLALKIAADELFTIKGWLDGFTALQLSQLPEMGGALSEADAADIKAAVDQAIVGRTALYTGGTAGGRAAYLRLIGLGVGR